MRYYPVVRQSPRPSRPQSSRVRQLMFLLGTAFIVGGLVKLAVDDEVAVVASPDLKVGPEKAAAAAQPDGQAPSVDTIDVAIVAALSSD